jgi:hypothetical protein
MGDAAMRPQPETHLAPSQIGPVVTWLDVVDEALAELSVDADRYTLQVSFAHDLVQEILQGHAPVQRLLEEVQSEETTS